MTAVGEKDLVWIDDVTKLINALNRCGIGSNPDTGDYDEALKIRTKWASVSNDMSMVSLSFEPMAYEQGLITELRALLSYGRSELQAASAAAGALLGQSGFGVDEIDDLTSMLAAGSISSNPTNYASATKLAAIIKRWADIWPLTLTNPVRDPIENVIPVFKDLKDHYNEVVMDLFPERTVQGDGSATGDVAPFVEADAVALAYSPSDVNSLGGLLFSAAFPDNTVITDSTNEQRVWFKNVVNGTFWNMFRLTRFSGGYTLNLKFIQQSGPGVNYAYNNAGAFAMVNVPAAAAIPSGLNCLVSFDGYALAQTELQPITQDETQTNNTGNIVRRVYSCTIDIPDNIALRGNPFITLNNASGGVMAGLWKCEVNGIMATGAGGSARSIWDYNGNPISNTTRLSTIVGMVSGVYRDSVFKSPYTKRYMQMLVWYDNYKVQQGRPTMATAVQSAFLRLQQTNGDPLADPTKLTTERICNLGFWLQGTSGIFPQTLQALYRYATMVLLLNVKLMCGDVGFIQYVTNETVVGTYVY
jgi:hypothetical protein